MQMIMEMHSYCSMHGQIKDEMHICPRMHVQMKDEMHIYPRMHVQMKNEMHICHRMHLHIKVTWTFAVGYMCIQINKHTFAAGCMHICEDKPKYILQQMCICK